MAYITLHAEGREVCRHNLIAATIIGRSPECDVMVRDILLSRRHCRIEPIGDGWRIIDLESRNGTRLGERRLRRHILREGQAIRLGRTDLRFHEGQCPLDEPQDTKVIRPADPFEALAGTVAGLLYVDPDEDPASGGHHADEEADLPNPALQPAGGVDDRYGAPQAMLIQLAADVAALRRQSVSSAVLARAKARCADVLPRRPVYVVLPGRNQTIATVNRPFVPDLSLQFIPAIDDQTAAAPLATGTGTCARRRALLAIALSLMVILATLLVLLCGSLAHMPGA